MIKNETAKRICVILSIIVFSFLFFHDAFSQNLELELYKAKSRSTAGLIITFTGGIIFGVSMLLTYSDYQYSYAIGYSYILLTRRVKAIYIAGDILGIITMGVGLAIHLPARKEVKRLEKERKITACAELGLLPEYRAAGIKLKISF
jgi:hypothetical protein